MFLLGLESLVFCNNLWPSDRYSVLGTAVSREPYAASNEMFLKL